ncbi:cell division cycle protein 20, partial [Haematococcus lacustris]
MNSNTTGLNPPTPGNTTSPHGTSKSIKLNFSKTPGGSKKLDRFIPLRPALDVDLANLQLTKENTGNGADGSEGASLSPSRDEFQRALAGQLGIDQSGRILAFRQKAPAPPEGHDNNLRGLYTDNLGPAPAKKNFRHIPQTQERILDAPDLVDDYYLNLLDWSCNNSIAIALGSTVYLWNAATGSVEELCTLPNEGDYVGSVAWSADGAYLAVGTSDAKVQIWDASRCKQIRELAGHTNRVSAVAWA